MQPINEAVQMHLPQQNPSIRSHRHPCPEYSPVTCKNLHENTLNSKMDISLLEMEDEVVNNVLGTEYPN